MSSSSIIVLKTADTAINSTAAGKEPRQLYSMHAYTMGSHKIKGFFSGIFGIYHQDQRKEEFQLHLLVKFIYSLGSI